MLSFQKLLVSFCILLTLQSQAQKNVINILDSGRKTSLRGLSVVNDHIVWASGSNGTVARSTDGGKTVEWHTVAGYEKRDFRDIEAFDANTAVIMAVAEPAVILKTTDGGYNWYKVYENNTKGMFLDAMDFDDKGNAYVIGDPVEGYLFRAFSIDYGEHWAEMQQVSPAMNVKQGEAFFAASGTNIRFSGDKNYPVLYVTGGLSSRLFYRDKFYDLNIVQGKESTGANSVAINSKGTTAVIVGGDFSKDSSSHQNCVITQLDKEPVFKMPQTPPHGYRSCVEYITKDKLITCGTSGADISVDGGMNWELISTQSFHVCRKAKNGNRVFLAGSNGKIAILSLK